MIFSTSFPKQTDNHLFINKIKSYQQVKSFPKYSFGNSFQQEDTRNKHRKTELSIQFYKFPGNLHQQPAMLEVDLADIIFGKR